MESLIPVINKLQDVFSTIGYRESEVQLPQIVVVGSQSSGKSSVLEGVVGRDFLPRGTGIVTRRPLILHLTHTSFDSLLREEKGGPSQSDWAEFGHMPSVVFTDFKQVREEIERETDRVTGSNKGISPIPITLTIYSDKVVNLSLVDLPGITKVPIGDQPADIEIQIRKMIFNYISNPNTLILAVAPANQDFATSEPLKIAKEVDKEGNRTLVVLTKLDLMDQGTDAMDVLTGKLVPIKLGIIGVVNRSQADINSKKSIQDCLKDESKFLQKKYPTLASINGIQYLAKTLNRLLMHHIRECLPQLKLRVSTMMVQCQSILRGYGEPVVDKHRTLLQIITHFASAYNSTIEGTARNIETTELCGGARICYIFHETFSNALEKLDPMENLKTLEILTAIRNATGPRPALFVPEVSFELLVKRQIRRLEEPSLNCVDLVYEEMLRIIQHCGFEIQQEMQRFPRLYERIHEVINHVLNSRLTPTKDFVSNLVSIQLAYINSKHPEFSSEASLINALQEGPSPFHGNVQTITENEDGIGQKTLQQQQNGEVGFDGIFDHRRSTVSNNVNAKHFQPTPHKESGGGPFGSLRRVPVSATDNASTHLTNGFQPDMSTALNSTTSAPTLTSSSKYNPSTWLFGRNQQQSNPTDTDIDNDNRDQNTNFAKSMERAITRSLSKREMHDCRVIERLIRSYFLIVRKTIQDMVPKAIMKFLVNHVRDNLQSELVRQLYNVADLDALLAESEVMAQKRAESAEMLEALNKANQVISEIRETHIW